MGGGGRREGRLKYVPPVRDVSVRIRGINKDSAGPGPITFANVRAECVCLPANMRAESVCRCAEEVRGRKSDRTCAPSPNVCELTLRPLGGLGEGALARRHVCDVHQHPQRTLVCCCVFFASRPVVCRTFASVRWGGGGAPAVGACQALPEFFAVARCVFIDSPHANIVVMVVGGWGGGSFLPAFAENASRVDYDSHSSQQTKQNSPPFFSGNFIFFPPTVHFVIFFFFFKYLQREVLSVLKCHKDSELQTLVGKSVVSSF